MKQFRIWTIVDEDQKDKVVNVLLDLRRLLEIKYRVYTEEIEVNE